ncbi:HEAT repeat domain-containing protein [Candidatus Hecatella orcuttiae]|jgi:hypothetical protein|uniref:HEAT repeat domain-containing protein n=1 Tax=Candidatus Hecatella orcuttiae TaxID=1935119 RepID=UPI002867CF1E|nr:HEAT repeat domain-containing protein [Candidatus Hecatella orcuttiae]
MGFLDRFRGDQVPKYIDKLEKALSERGRYGKEGEKTARRLGELGDKRAVKPLLEYAKFSHTPVSVEALANIGGEDAVQALRELYYRDRYHKNRPWLTHVERALVKLEDYGTCRDIMLSSGSPNSRSAAEVVIKDSRWRKDKEVILKFLATIYVPPVVAFEKLLEEMDPDVRRDKELILSLIKTHGYASFLEKYISVEEMIAAVKHGIEQINRDQEYYLREQPFGAPENYDWEKARKPLYDWLERLERIKAGRRET